MKIGDLIISLDVFLTQELIRFGGLIKVMMAKLKHAATAGNQRRSSYEWCTRNHVQLLRILESTPCLVRGRLYLLETSSIVGGRLQRKNCLHSNMAGAMSQAGLLVVRFLLSSPGLHDCGEAEPLQRFQDCSGCELTHYDSAPSLYWSVHMRSEHGRWAR